MSHSSQIAWSPSPGRDRLPFGVVMATAGASALAGRCGFPELVRPLLALAILQALWVSARAIAQYSAAFRCGWRPGWALGPAHEHSGIHTVPLGLAVIASGLLALGAAAASHWPIVLAVVCLAIAWGATVICVGRFIGSLAMRGFDVYSLDGTWFLVPAVLLGAAIATERLGAQLAGDWAGALRLMAAGSVLVGWLGYWSLAAVTVIRIRRHGLGGAPLAPWWIAMGCAGLAAAALGGVLQSGPEGWLSSGFLSIAMLISATVAVALGVPVLLLSSWFLLKQGGPRSAGAWPPTFSSAVFALGSLQVGRILHSKPFGVIGLGAAYATLVLWLVTTVWNLRFAYVTRSSGQGRG